jgi:hypothetical protein
MARHGPGGKLAAKYLAKNGGNLGGNGWLARFTVQPCILTLHVSVGGAMGCGQRASEAARA